MADRYFLSEPPIGGRAVLHDQEAHHLLHVMRAKPGMEVFLFNGSGVEYTARVERTTRSTVELIVLSHTMADRELKSRLVLGVALPKGDRQKWLVEKLTELGVSELTPIETERGVAQPVAGTLDRLRRTVVEASKQCGRNRLMDISNSQTAEQFLACGMTGRHRWIAHPGGKPLGEIVDAIRAGGGEPREIAVAIGPEGGFTDREISLAQNHGWEAINLGARILRVETAAILLASVAGLLIESH
jgi:16S rRNA (uracil1498-N3)-methyltransferase